MLPYVPTHAAHMGKHAHMFIHTHTHTHTHMHTPELLLVQCRAPPFDSGLFSQHLNAPPEVGIALGDLLLKNLDLQRGRDPATEVCERITDRMFTYVQYANQHSAGLSKRSLLRIIFVLYSEQ